MNQLAKDGLTVAKAAIDAALGVAENDTPAVEGDVADFAAAALSHVLPTGLAAIVVPILQSGARVATDKAAGSHNPDALSNGVKSFLQFAQNRLDSYIVDLENAPAAPTSSAPENAEKS